MADKTEIGDAIDVAEEDKLSKTVIAKAKKEAQTAATEIIEDAKKQAAEIVANMIRDAAAKAEETEEVPHIASAITQSVDIEYELYTMPEVEGEAEVWAGKWGGRQFLIPRGSTNLLPKPLIEIIETTEAQRRKATAYAKKMSSEAKVLI